MVRPKISVKIVSRRVAEYFSINPDKLCHKTRERKFAYPRQIAMYILSKDQTLTLAQIGKELGGRDHSTVIHARDNIIGLMDVDHNVRRDVLSIESILN